MTRPRSSTSWIIRADAYLEQLRALIEARGINETMIPYRLIVEAIETIGSTTPLGDIVDEWTLTDVLNCTRPTLRRYIELGLPVIRLDRRKWYSLSSVEAWLRSKERVAEPRPPGRPPRKPTRALAARAPQTGGAL